MTKRILAIITMFLGVLLFALLYEFWHFKSEQNQRVFTTGQKTTQELSKEINRILRDVASEAHKLRDLVVENSLDDATLEKLIIESAHSMEEILGVTVSYEPYAWNESVHLHSPYFDKQLNKIVSIGDLYDYTDERLETASWYTDVRETGSQWIEPYYGQAAQTMVADYGVPFYFQSGTKKGKLKGTVNFSISLSGFTDIVQTLSLGKTGYGFVTSPQGAILAHPNSEYIGVEGLKDLIAQNGHSEKMKAYRAMLNGDTGHATYFDDEKQQKVIFFYDKIETSNWRIGVVFFKKDIIGGSEKLKHRYIYLSLTASLLCFLIITVIFNRDFLSVSELWQLSLVASTVMVLNILLIGYLQHSTNEDSEKINSPPITDSTVLGKFVSQVEKKANNTKTKPPKLVPYGLFLERIEFHDSYNLNISGKAWMKFMSAPPTSDSVGFRFPQTAPFAEATVIEEIYRKETEKYTLIGYDFRTTMRLNFNYSDYPFDKRHIALEIRPRDINSNVLLVPDLQSYAYTNPSQKSGISTDIRLPGNKILHSYFSYRIPTYDTRFGFSSDKFRDGIPSLYFNINVKRVLITSFITYLIPIFVSLVMIFILICSAEKSNDSFAGAGIIQGLAAFFFVLIFSHIDLRKDILTGELVYLEYYYFAAYLVILFSAYNLIIFTRKQHKIFDFNQNIIMKTSFWPLFFLMVLCVTLVKFY